MTLPFTILIQPPRRNTLGTYIYKAKVEKLTDHEGKVTKLGAYDFWYKPYYGYDIPDWQTKRETAGETFCDKHPEGVQYAYFAPTDSEENWDKNKWCPVYNVGNLDPVISDMGKTWDRAFCPENICGLVKGAKNGKKTFDTSASAIKTALLMEFNEIPESCKENVEFLLKMEKRVQNLAMPKPDPVVISKVNALYGDVERVAIKGIYTQRNGWENVEEPATTKNLFYLYLRGVSMVNLEVEEDGIVRHPDYSMKELLDT